MNFRIILHDIPGVELRYGIHEVVYDRKGRISGWKETPLIAGQTLEELARVVDQMLYDLNRFYTPLVLTDLQNPPQAGPGEGSDS